MVNSGNISVTGCEGLSGSLVPLENFTYGNQKLGCLIQWNLQQTQFSGVTISLCMIICVLKNCTKECCHVMSVGVQIHVVCVRLDWF